MTGMDKILSQISSDTEYICDKIKNKSAIYCTDIRNSAVAKADEIREKCDIDIEKLRKDIFSRAESSALIEKRSIMLEAKQQIIKDMLYNCLEHLCSLPSDDYFNLILKMVSKYSIKGKGEICFSSNDFLRMPDNFHNSINAVSNGDLILSEISSDLDYGFILKYGKIEINCSFSAVFSSRYDEFCDVVSAVLFA